MPDFENAFNLVCELVKDFKENEARYLSPQYQEAEVRRDFIDKLFEALGWDVYHRTQKNPYEQEVKVEKGVSVGKAQKRADYAFYINPEYRQPKFFCEAKKPSRSLKNADDYFQTIRYGWNSNTPVAVLTDFEEFHVLDCRYKPKLNNVLENPNHKQYSYNDYANPEKFKEIYYLFARDDVAKNSLEKYSECFPKGKTKGKTSFKSTIQAIDDDFLEYIDDVREILAKAFKKNDSKLSSEELTEATQRTIDRIVFIRFLEDKLIEPEYYISEFDKKGNAWTEFISVCRKLDAKYNGIVFKKHFIDEQNFQGPEQSTFKKICDEMSYLNSPYDFNAIPIHILGSIYERFLGKVVNATAQRVKVEEKPEVRKAGGVYYTPKYIVDYIVDNTVGKIIRNENDNIPLGGGVPAGRGGSEQDQKNPLLGGVDTEGGRGGFQSGLSPKEISSLRFADIACGSGSFLIGVFETLLKYHTEYYQLHPEEAKKDGCINKDGQWILSIKQKQNILLNNIYGVDIDNQAVEVTQLSLALKMLEDESTATANEMQVLFHEKILPDLSKNIVCGNSLIGTDILQGKMFPTDEERKVNPMDFEKRFPSIFNNGGFDAIVGNPPYVDNRGFDKMQLNYFYSNYKSFTSAGTDEFKTRKFNTFVAFIERTKLILNSAGVCGYIIHKNFLKTTTYKGIRKFVLDNYTISKIIDWGPNQFSHVIAETISIFITKDNVSNNNIEIEFFEKDKHIKSNFINQNIYNYSFDYIFNINLSPKVIDLISKIEGEKAKLKEFVNINNGLVTGDDKKFISKTSLGNEYKPCVTGKDIKRYTIIGQKGFVLYDPIKLLRARDIKIFEAKEKLIMQMININFVLAYDENQLFNLGTTYSITSLNENVSLKYLMALLNSKLLNFYYLKKFTNESTLTNAISTKNLFEIPIVKINISISSNNLAYINIIKLVDQMLEAKKQLQTIKTDRDKTYYENKCTDLDHAIDSEVYKLYGLTEEEIKIVEGKG